MIEAVWLVLIGAGVLLCVVRMLKGPTVVDRAVAVDAIATITTALLVLLGFVFGRFVYVDVALVYGVLTFVGAVAIARYLERGL